jgi:hypothetical protein
MNENRKPNEIDNNPGVDFEFINISLSEDGDKPEYTDVSSGEPHQDELPSEEPAAGDSGNDTPPPPENPVPMPGDAEDNDETLRKALESIRVVDLDQEKIESLHEKGSMFMGPKAPKALTDGQLQRFDPEKDRAIINDPEALDPGEIRDRIENIVDARLAAESESDAETDDYQDSSEQQPNFEIMHFKDDELRVESSPDYFDNAGAAYAEADTFVAARKPENPDVEVVLNAHGEGCRIVAINDSETGALIHVSAEDMFTTRGEELIDAAFELSDLNPAETRAIIFGDTDEMAEEMSEAGENWNNRLSAHLQERGLETDVEIINEGEGKEVFLHLRGDGTHKIEAYDSNGAPLYESGSDND